MNGTSPKVEAFIGKAKKWREELELLRTIVLNSGLNEELKWGKPCYTFEGQNVIILNGLKESCAFMFFKGALLKDPEKVLTAPGPNSQSGRWIKFTSVHQIVAMEPVLKAYVREAIEVEKAGLKVVLKKITELKFPEEFEKKLEENPTLQAAFYTLTPGRRRAYNLYFSAPKQSKTRESRIEKCVQQILDGKGFNER